MCPATSIHSSYCYLMMPATRVLSAPITRIYTLTVDRESIEHRQWATDAIATLAHTYLPRHGR